MSDKKYPPRVWVVPLDEGNEAINGIYFAAQSAWNTGWRKPKPKEYISEVESAALVAQARAEAFEEAAECAEHMVESGVWYDIAPELRSRAAKRERGEE